MISNQITETSEEFKFSITFIYLSLQKGNLHILSSQTVFSSIVINIISLDIFKFFETKVEYNLSERFLSILAKKIENITIILNTTVQTNKVRNILFFKRLLNIVFY
jgi:hypothetical protein